MTNNWYKRVLATESLTQGDIIFDCPVSVWKKIEEADLIEFNQQNEIKMLKSSVEFLSVDVIVMTQACDIEQNKVRNVTLCPHVSISDFKKDWETAMKNQNQIPSEKAWNSSFNRIKDGYIWNQSVLNSFKIGRQVLEHRIVDFSEVYTIPKSFLESLLMKRKKTRFQLLPPYREHLSQAFARFYMRVGLPTPINKLPEISLPKE